ncbi:hypothetical protein [Rhodovulum euryhalinum]|uniref:AbiU2 domain-containing protein n=1 Tax=Rhodovulum euryhalinum TaxID=35805 RepID=UPI001051948B|nr:hypothetical protein [Rhodovulum euryhalinum]
MTDGPDNALNVATRHFDYFWGECQRLGRVYWTLHELYFGEPETSVPLLNKLAPGLFSEMLEVYSERLHLGIARLTDGKEARTKSGPRRNLSAHGVVAAFQDAGLPAEVEGHLADMLSRFRKDQDLEILRHWHIAHLDAEVIINGQPLSVPSLNSLNDFFVVLQQFIETASESLGRPVTEAVFLVNVTGYSERLLIWLDALDFANASDEAIRFMNRNTLPPCFRPSRKINLPPRGGR